MGNQDANQFLLNNKNDNAGLYINQNPFDFLRTASIDLHQLIPQVLKDLVKITRPYDMVHKAAGANGGIPAGAGRSSGGTQLHTNTFHMSRRNINNTVLRQNNNIITACPKK